MDRRIQRALANGQSGIRREQHTVSPVPENLSCALMDASFILLGMPAGKRGPGSPGRPRDPAKRAKIIAGLAAGLPQSVIARQTGINIKTVASVRSEQNTVVALQQAEEMEKTYRGEIVKFAPLQQVAKTLARNLKQSEHLPASNDAIRIYQQNLGICQKKEDLQNNQPLFMFAGPTMVSVHNQPPEQAKLPAASDKTDEKV